MYDTFFAGVNSDSELNIYDYYGNKINSVGVKIGDYPYYNVDNPAFKVHKSDSDYVVSVYDGTTYTESLLN